MNSQHRWRHSVLDHRELRRCSPGPPSSPRTGRHARKIEPKVPSVVMTFEPHPMKVLHPDRKLTRIFDFEDQRNCLEGGGHRHCLVVEPFSREFSQVTASGFERVDLPPISARKPMIVGYDFSFGADRKGLDRFLAK